MSSTRPANKLQKDRTTGLEEACKKYFFKNQNVIRQYINKKIIIIVIDVADIVVINFYY